MIHLYQLQIEYGHVYMGIMGIQKCIEVTNNLFGLATWDSPIKCESSMYTNIHGIILYNKVVNII